MKSPADGLPPEIAQQIHPDWRKNEAAYWAVRDQLLSQYEGQWVAFGDGGVIAAASAPLEVFLAVQKSGGHPFVIRVGHEDEPWYRIRRTSFSYDSAYPSRNVVIDGNSPKDTFGQKHSTFSLSGGGPHELRRNDPPGVRPGDREHAEGAGACSR